MRGYGKIVDFPKYIKNSGKYIIAPFSHVVQIKYPNGNIILIEEIDNKERKRLEYNIKKAFFSPEIIYSASMDELQWSASFCLLI